MRKAGAALLAVALTASLLGCRGGTADGGDTAGGESTADGESTAAGTPELSPLRFFREYVTVTPSHRTTSVTALYHFRNESDRPIEQVIIYPFPVDRHHLYPRVVKVWEQTDEGLRPMGFAHRDRSVMWRMRFAPHEEKSVRVNYTQDIRKKHAVYIVTTTKEWRRPIELAEFEFRIPPELKDVQLSFEPDREETRGDTLIYYMSRREFMPAEDLTVTWR